MFVRGSHACFPLTRYVSVRYLETSTIALYPIIVHTIDIIHLDRDWKRDHVSNIWQYKMIDPILVAV